jgi:hypothetical protein
LPDDNPLARNVGGQSGNIETLLTNQFSCSPAGQCGGDWNETCDTGVAAPWQRGQATTMKPFHTKWLLYAALCLVVMLTAVSCVSPTPADRARTAADVFRERDEIKTLRLSIYVADTDWQRMTNVNPASAVFGLVGALGNFMDTLPARKDFAVETQLRSRYETNFFRCLKEALGAEIQSNAHFQVTGPSDSTADADLILLIQNVTYETGQRSTWATRTPAYVASALITKDPGSFKPEKSSVYYIYTTNYSWLWRGQIFPDYMARNKHDVTYSVKDAKDEEDIARRIAQALAVELADDFRQGVFMKGQTPLERSPQH